MKTLKSNIIVIIPSLILSVCFCKTITSARISSLDDFSPIPIFVKVKPGAYILFPKVNNRLILFNNKEIRHSISRNEDVERCYIYFNENHFREHFQLWPNLIFGKAFICLILEKGYDPVIPPQPWRYGDVNTFADLLLLCHNTSARNNIVMKLPEIDNILELSEILNLDWGAMNEVWKIIIKNSIKILDDGKIMKGIITNHLAIHLINLKKTKSAKIGERIRIEFYSEVKSIILISHVRSARIIFWKHYVLPISNCILFLTKKSLGDSFRLIHYGISFKVQNKFKSYECLHKGLSDYVWRRNICITTMYKANRSKSIKCTCKNQGIVTIGEIRRSNIKKEELPNFWGFNYLWDFEDDFTKYLKEDALRYLPVIAVMRMIITCLSSVTLLAFIYLGFVLCFKKKRIFYAKETISVVLFLACLTFSHLAFHFSAYVGLVWKRNFMAIWCRLVTFFHIIYVLLVGAFQMYVFTLSIANNKNDWLHNVALPILIISGPLGAGAIDYITTKRGGLLCHYLVFNLSRKVTFIFFLIPCAVFSILTPIMAIISNSILHRGRRLFGFIPTFTFSVLHLICAAFLVLANTDEDIELQYYFQFCVAAIIESLFHILLAVLLLILSATNTSLIDRHCTFDLDTRALCRYFDNPRASIQLVGEKG